MDTRVGYAATSVLENLCKEAVADAWKRRDYSVVVEYATKYELLRAYNKED